ncbi:hypothetical protein AVEN_259965-1 [Araneus ventricosus]|uniref:Tubuliform egg casing silk strands structural domain-containing protein n=1 Tax=Araneus ventricosus TaxID=182803 RepID=A0A4Y2NU05_ARAVE|nr:hypothetical protein AVEN_259965-1 [Araneus ventricosus]
MMSGKLDFQPVWISITPFGHKSTSTGVGDFWQPTFSFPPGNTFSSSSASANAGAASTQASTIPSSLDTFISTFTKAVHSSTVLSDAYDISQTSPQSFADFVYHAIHEHLMSNGISDPRDIATYAAQPIGESFEVLTYPMLVSIDANAMGKYLLDEGILNDMNAASLASAFAKEMETSAKRSVEKSFQESKFQALEDGYVGFFKAQGLYTREKLPVAEKYYGKEFRLAGENFGRNRLL